MAKYIEWSSATNYSIKLTLNFKLNLFDLVILHVLCFPRLILRFEYLVA